MPVPAILELLLSPEFETGVPFLARLLSTLEQPVPLSTVTVQNFCKILSSLIKHRRKQVAALCPLPGAYRLIAFTCGGQTFDALKCYPSFVKRMATHATGSSSRFAEILWQLMEDEALDPMGVVEVTFTHLPCNWLE